MLEADEPLIVAVTPAPGLIVIVFVALEPPFAGTTIGKVSAAEL